MILDCVERSKVGKMAPESVQFYTKRAGHLRRAEQLGTLPASLHLMRAHHVDAFISLRRREGVSEHTISKELVTLRKALKLAKRRGRFRGDLAELLPSGFAPAYKPRTRTLSMPELERLLPELGPDRGARVAFAIATGAFARLFTPWLKMVRDLALAYCLSDIERCSSNDLRRTFATWMRIEGLPTDILGATLGQTLEPPQRARNWLRL